MTHSAIIAKFKAELLDKSDDELIAIKINGADNPSPPEYSRHIAATQILNDRQSTIEQKRHDDLFLQSERSLSISRKAFRISIWATIIAIIAIIVSIKDTILSLILTP